MRPRLLERLNEGLDRKLTLISAPAGSGKTTVVSKWVAESGRRTAWLSLDERDNDLTRFLVYFVAAVQTIAPHVGEGVAAVLQAPQPPPYEAVLTTLLNEIAALPDQILFVLDDYHLIDTQVIDQALNFLLEHLPLQIHLIITTREDPNLPLARLRARRQLTELRAADLRFTPDEAAAFLNQVMGLTLSMSDIAVLEERTEGWIAGLQLAALSLQGHHNISEFIQAFTGNHRYIVDYLVEEVLERQPEAIRNFLLQTSILDRLNESLCNAVTIQQEGANWLEALERGNFFIIPLDDNRQWYRYHHLFADVLRTYLLTEQPDQFPVLHRRASEWYEQHGSVVDAIHHALAAKDSGRVANLIEMVMPTMRRSRQESIVLSWLQALPDEVVKNRPVLSVHYAGVLLQTGKLEGVEEKLRYAERWLVPTSSLSNELKSAIPEPVVIDEEEFRSLAGSVAMYRAASALIVGDIVGTMKHARQVSELVPENDYLRRGAAAGLLGLAYWSIGELEAAHRAYLDCQSALQSVGFIADAIGCSITLADLRLTQGRLHDALRTYKQALDMASEHGIPVLRGTADMYVGMAEIERERNNLSNAKQHLLRSKELGELAGLPQNPYRWCLAMARILETEGELNGALNFIQEAERLYAGDLSPNVRPVAAFKARVWIAEGKLDEAFNWSRERGLSIENELSYLHEFEHITLARILLAQSRRDRSLQTIIAAINFLERLLKAAEADGRTGNVIEILVLLALAYQTQDDTSTALIALERALTLGEPEGYARIFVNERQPMARLLEIAVEQMLMQNYARQLLNAFGTAERSKPSEQDLTEPLSERELEVLRLFGTDLSGPEIANELIISLNTLRTHTKNIYTKLGVNNRRTAVRRAEELNLL